MKLNIHKKLFIYISIIIFFLILLFIFTFSFYTYKNVEKEEIQNANQISNKTSIQLETLFYEMDKIALYISTNPNVMKAFSRADKEDLTNQELVVHLMGIITSVSIPNNASRYRISLYNEKGNFISVGIPYSFDKVNNLINSSEYKSWYDNILIKKNNKNITGFTEDEWGDGSTKFSSLHREIFDYSSLNIVNGIIQIQIPSNIIEDIMTLDSEKYSCILIDSNGNLIYKDKIIEEIDYNELYANYTKSSISGNDSKFNNYIYSGTKLDNGWTFLLIQSQDYIFKIIYPFIFATILISLLAFLASAFIVFYVIKATTKPLTELSSSIKKITIENLSLEVDFSEYSNEFIMLEKVFKKMLDRLKLSLDENMKMKAYEIRANMLALQAQIDPHFLFNILTIIKALSRENNPQQISLTCDYLVNMLRYISDYNDKIITFKTELNYAEQYLNLMKIRYEEHFEFIFDIEDAESINNIMLPKLSLQPILENCFKYGFVKVKPIWIIKIKMYIVDNMWYINVEDNGVGITDYSISILKDKVEEFYNNPSDSVASMKIGGMGLISIIARMNLLYKNSFFYEVKRVSESGTSITLGGAIDNEYFNS